MSNEEKLDEIIIPQNITSQRRILGVKLRNWIEGGIAAGIVALLIRLIPFETKVGIIFTVFIAGSVLILNLLGIKGMSISETVINLVISSRTKHKYHLRSIKYVRKRKEEESDYTAKVHLNESIAEKGLRLGKEFLKEQLNKR